MHKDLGIGVIGLGMGRDLFALNRDPATRFEVRGVCGKAPEKTARIAGQHGIGFATTDYCQLIERDDVQYTMLLYLYSIGDEAVFQHIHVGAGTPTEATWRAGAPVDIFRRDQWTHVASTWDAKAVRLYANGRRVGEGRFTARLSEWCDGEYVAEGVLTIGGTGTGMTLHGRAVLTKPPSPWLPAHCDWRATRVRAPWTPLARRDTTIGYGNGEVTLAGPFPGQITAAVAHAARVRMRPEERGGPQAHSEAPFAREPRAPRPLLADPIRLVSDQPGPWNTESAR